MRLAVLAALFLGCGEPPSAVFADADPFDACEGAMPDDPRLAALAAFARGRLAEERVPGAAIAIARDGAVLHLAALGSASSEGCDPITPDTRFLTLFGRHVTAAAVVAAVADGDASFDDRLADFYPPFGAVGAHDPTAITLDHLLTHTAGYSINHSGSCDPVDAYFERTREYPMWAPPGRVHMVLHLNLTLASRVLGPDYRGRVRALALDPLGMSDGFDRIGAAKAGLAIGHTPAGDELRQRSVSLIECPVSEPYLGYLASARDAAALLAVLSAGPGELTDGRAPAFYPPEQATRGGFVRGPLDGEVDWAYAGDDAFGFAYAVRVVPDDGFAVAVFENGDHGDPAAIAVEAIRLFLDRQPAYDVTPQSADTLPSLAGAYEEYLTGSRIVVADVDGALEIAVDGEEPAPLSPARRDALSYADDVLGFTWRGKPHQLRFWRGEDGRGAIISQDTFRQALGPPFYRAE